jgi:aldose sugar dehydrogenase
MAASTDPDLYIKDSDLDVMEVAEGLESPTSMAFLDENRILVLEKQGKVKEVIDDKVSDVAILDIKTKVDDRFERGMLGIAISENKQNDERDDKDDSKDGDISRYIFLFYTEKIPDWYNIKCTSNDCLTNNFAANHLYRYQLEDGKLVDPRLILEIPGSKNNRTILHIGGPLAIGPDNHLYVTIGDGTDCSGYEACLENIQRGPLRAKTANIQGGIEPNGMGGILRINVSEGEFTGSEGTLGDEYPLNLYYAYGIRNSFGLDFDPVTGNLWDTENGPAFGDEINLVEPGFNSGWALIQGMWPITNYSQIDPEPNGPQRGFFMNGSNNESEHKFVGDSLIGFDGKGKYSEPELAWNKTVGVTAIEFISSDRLGEEYENDILVGTFNDGTIYHFDLDDGRRNILLEGPLTDKVANDNEELEQLVFAKGFGAISDIEASPDGLIYVLSISKGKVYKIIPEG